MKWFKMRRVILLLLLTVLLLTSLSCQNNDDSALVVFAASSLSNAVKDISTEYEKDNEIGLMTVFAGSNTLRTQIEYGAYADIFISANEGYYKDLLEKGYLLEGKELLMNDMVLIVSRKSSVEINDLEDLRKSHNFIIPTHGVPAGIYVKEILSNLNQLYGDDYSESVEKNVVSEEINVRQVLMKIVLGEGDASIVYRTDVTKDVVDALKVIEIPEAFNVKASYWVALIKHKTIKDQAIDYFDYLSEKTSSEIFNSYKFDTINYK